LIRDPRNSRRPGGKTVLTEITTDFTPFTSAFFSLIFFSSILSYVTGVLLVIVGTLMDELGLH